MDVYYRQASSVSRYYIVHVGVEFTCGSLASQNPPENYSFDKHYDLYTGYINIRPYQYSSGGKKSSDITFKAAWPATSTFTSTVSSSFGASISGNSDLTAGTDLMGGVKIESTNSRGFTLSFSNTTSIHGPEPAIYLNTAVDSLNQKQWSYVYAGLGKSLLLDTYYMFEVKNNGSGYQDYSFKFDVEINMKNVAWKIYPWQQLKDLNASYNEEYGMYQLYLYTSVGYRVD